ncbi:MAG: hypothetical protein ACODUE_03910 [Synechococcus sp.]
MTADPEAMDALVGWQPKCSVVKPHFHAVKSAASKTFELQGRMGGIGLEQGEILIGEAV